MAGGELLAEAAAFVAAHCGEAVDDADEAAFAESLRSGVKLCSALESLGVEHVSYNAKAKLAFAQMENISAYVEACRRAGVPEADLFLTSDLYEEKLVGAVVKNVLAVKRLLGGGADKAATPVAKASKPAAVVPASPQTLCARCGKPVYATELLRALDRDWHKACFACTNCSKPIPKGQHLDHDAEPYCKPCHEKLFRPKGFRGGAVGVADSFVEDAGPPTAEVAALSVGGATVPYAQLRSDAPGAPEAWAELGVDPAKRESYLSDAEFEQVLGMSKAAFGELKGWKQANLRKQHLLF